VVFLFFRFCPHGWYLLRAKMDRKLIKISIVLMFVTQVLQMLMQRSCFLMNAQCHSPKIFRAVIHSIHTGHDGEQCVCSTDIGCRLFALDMLFTWLQCHPQSHATMAVD